MTTTATCPVCGERAPTRPIEVISRLRKRLRPQPGRRLDRVEIADHGDCVGAGDVVSPDRPKEDGPWPGSV